jgi:5,10-methylenetetrahydromethanopterin reductase
MEINCAFATAIATPDHIRTAESLGYARAWVYDSPALYADPWMTAALAARATTRIRIGVAVITPHLRHVVANAGALAHLATLAPGRTDIGVGSGFTSAALLARRPAPWSLVERYVLALRALLRGEPTEWDGVTVQLLHGPASGVRLPVEVPIWIAAHGPKGYAVAGRVGDGIVTNPVLGENPVPVSGRVSLTFHGTVLDDGESIEAPRVRAAAGPGAALALHIGPGGPASGLPELARHQGALAAVPAHRRHLETHRGHLIEMNALDRDCVSAEVIRRATRTGTRAEVAEFLDRLRDAGAAAALYQPAGPDIERELRAFAAAAGL